MVKHTMSILTSPLLYLLVLASVVPKVASIKCYSCTSVKNKQCGEPFQAQSIATTECLKNTTTCLKLKSPTYGGGWEPITRGCYDEKYCNKLSVCIECNDQDLCNVAIHVMPSFFVFSALSAVLYYCTL